MITQGSQAPDFTLPRDGGATITLSSLRPGKVVLYFYPKDDTPGCTLEAQDFNARIADFTAADTTVIGISKDSVKSHDKFCKKFGLGIMLVSDEAGQTCDFILAGMAYAAAPAQRHEWTINRLTDEPLARLAATPGVNRQERPSGLR